MTKIEKWRAGGGVRVSGKGQRRFQGSKCVYHRITQGIVVTLNCSLS